MTMILTDVKDVRTSKSYALGGDAQLDVYLSDGVVILARYYDRSYEVRGGGFRRKVFDCYGTKADLLNTMVQMGADEEALLKVARKGNRGRVKW